MHTDQPDTSSGLETITTLKDLGQYLQGLRAEHVTQLGLATRSGHKIGRSRISAIENAQREPVTEYELRVYMRGLKCAPPHIDQAVDVLKRCTAIPTRQSPSDPDATSPAAPDTYPAGLGGAEDNPAPPQEKPDNDPPAATIKQHPLSKSAVAPIVFIGIVVAIIIVGVRSLLANPGGQSIPPSQARNGGQSIPLSHDLACRPRMPFQPRAQGEVRNLIEATYRICVAHPAIYFYQTWTPTTVTAFTPSGQGAVEYFVHVNPDGYVELRITGPQERNGTWSASWQQNPTSDCWNELVVTDPSGQQVDHSTETNCNPTR